jgi:hypothetical protein
VNWHEDVACRDADPDMFFPIGTTGAALRQMEEAKRICRDCPVQIQCLWLGAGERGRRWRMGRHHAGRAARHPEHVKKNDNH